jgi:lysophospholipid acyltransferase (LPLAT)-like uncharacterized protein
LDSPSNEDGREVLTRLPWRIFMGATSKKLASRYRVDDVPPLLRPLHNVYSYGTAATLFGYAQLVRATSTIEIIGQEQIDEYATYIFCYWHTYTPVYFCCFSHHSDHAWMQHPSWMVKHVHIMVRMVGVRYLIYGSTGHSGREAADVVVRLLRQGCSTALMPDGPRGPAGVLKDGVLHISQQSGVPIVPIRFRPSRCVRLNGWDRKHFPIPFGAIRFEYGTPVSVTGSNFEEARHRVTELLGGGTG